MKNNPFFTLAFVLEKPTENDLLIFFFSSRLLQIKFELSDARKNLRRPHGSVRAEAAASLFQHGRVKGLHGPFQSYTV